MTIMDEEELLSGIYKIVQRIREKGITCGFAIEDGPVLMVKLEQFNQPVPSLKCAYWYLSAYDAALLSLRQIAPAKEFCGELDTIVRVMKEYGKTSPSYAKTRNWIESAYRRAALREPLGSGPLKNADPPSIVKTLPALGFEPVKTQSLVKAWIGGEPLPESGAK